MTHICVSKLTIIGSDNGLLPGLRQAIIWTNAGILLISPFGTNFSEILIEIHIFSFKKMHLKMSGNWWPFCLGLIVLRRPSALSETKVGVKYVFVFKYMIFLYLYLITDDIEYLYLYLTSLFGVFEENTFQTQLLICHFPLASIEPKNRRVIIHTWKDYNGVFTSVTVSILIFLVFHPEDVLFDFECVFDSLHLYFIYHICICIEWNINKIFVLNYEIFVFIFVFDQMYLTPTFSQADAMWKLKLG